MPVGLSGSVAMPGSSHLQNANSLFTAACQTLRRRHHGETVAHDERAAPIFRTGRPLHSAGTVSASTSPACPAMHAPLSSSRIYAWPTQTYAAPLSPPPARLPVWRRISSPALFAFFRSEAFDVALAANVFMLPCIRAVQRQAPAAPAKHEVCAPAADNVRLF